MAENMGQKHERENPADLPVIILREELSAVRKVIRSMERHADAEGVSVPDTMGAYQEAAKALENALEWHGWAETVAKAAEEPPGIEESSVYVKSGYWDGLVALARKVTGG